MSLTLPPRARFAYESLVQELESLSDGAKLPPVRNLMNAFGVSQAALSSALVRLEAEGWLERRARSGIYKAVRAVNKPRLLLAEPAFFLNSSPFFEIFMGDLISPYRSRPSQMEVHFTRGAIIPIEDIQLSEMISPDLHSRVERGDYGGVIAIGVDEKVTKWLESTSLPVVAYGVAARNFLQVASLEACSIGVAELAKRGCRRIELFSTPHVPLHEAFHAALTSAGVEGRLVPHELGWEAVRSQSLAVRLPLFWRGRQVAEELFGPHAGQNPLPDGIVTLDDRFTAGLLSALPKFGVTLGRDIQVASYANKGSSTLVPWEDQLVQLKFSMAEMAASLHAFIDVHEQGGSATDWPGSVAVDTDHGSGRMVVIRPRLELPDF